MRRRALAVLAALLIGLGSWQVGAGGYIHAKAWLGQALIERAWRRVRAGDADAKPWPWADTRPLARLLVPRLGVALVVLAGGSGRTLAFAPGHVDGSALPGAPGVSVIAGHRDTHFRMLRDLRLGDALVLERPSGAPLRYRVAATTVVDARRARIDPVGGRSTLLLSTCYPFDALTAGGPLRYLVFAERVEGAS